MAPKLILASNRSSIDYYKDREETTSIGGLTQALVNCLSPEDLWVAVSGGDNDSELVNEHGLVHTKGKNFEFYQKKIFLERSHYQQYYEGFSNSFLWPLFHLDNGAYHEKKGPYPSPKFDGNEFFRYFRVNKTFADAIVETAGKDTLVWLQDYHLLLAACEIKKQKPALPVGQFIHIPQFKPEHIESYLTDYSLALGGIEQVLEGMLSNDLLGFHVDDYVQNFGRSVENFVRTAKVEQTKQGLKINFSGHNCYVESFPIGVDVGEISRQAATPLRFPNLRGRASVEELVEESRNKRRKIFVGVERSDYTKGLVERMAILDKLLERNIPLTYIGVVSLSREKIPAYRNLLREIRKRERRLNRKWEAKKGYAPFNLIYDTVNPPQNYALLREADCVMITTIADGMNLVFNESVLAKQNLPSGKRGIIALGNCGARRLLKSREFGHQHGIVSINPFNAERSAEDIALCLNSRYSLSGPLIRYVRTLDVNTWRNSFLSRLKEIKEIK